MISDKDPRRWQERADGRLISEDNTAMSNLPREFIAREVYHNSPVYGPNSRYRGDMEIAEVFYDVVKGKK